MIDQDKMRALATELRGPCTSWTEQQKLRQAGNAIDLLLAELEAAAADKRDAKRYRLLNSIPFGPGVPAAYRGIYFSFAVSDGKPGFIRSCRGEEMSAAIDAALAQRQGEGS
ncbi:hypothetical protein WK78_29045 [Burkholderia cepacia]|uniref:hypothetical protein n=1 Tax=Burkholderia cepacia TaxID=292 RepID=UPI0007558C0E|nr:hypothetical protein [Burkholderia cepacia]KVV20333.1 hypothetical protein WK78_29045 [Burkholderia cepacia]